MRHEASGCERCATREKLEYFFFSSRRRHTRLQGDWSSDVCSSDLVAQTLNAVALAPDATKRLALVESARSTLADWPRSHFNYRSGEVRQMLGMLDDAKIGRASCRERGVDLGGRRIIKKKKKKKRQR